MAIDPHNNAMETELPEETGSAGIRTDNVDMVIELEPRSTKSIAEMSPVQQGNKMKSDEQDIPKQEFRTYSPEKYAKVLASEKGKSECYS